MLGDKQLFKVPDWFKVEAGFAFVDGDGDLCVYLGAGRRQVLVTCELVVKPTYPKGYDEYTCGHVSAVRYSPDSQHLYAYRYKGEWQIGDLIATLQENPEWLMECSQDVSKAR